MAVFLDQALRGDEITVWGDGCAVRDYVYVGDVARAFCLAATSESAAGVFNVGSGEGHSVNDLIAAIERLLGRAVPRRYAQGRAFDVPVNVLDVSLAGRVLGWRPRLSFQEALERTLRWLEASR